MVGRHRDCVLLDGLHHACRHVMRTMCTAMACLTCKRCMYRMWGPSMHGHAQMASEGALRMELNRPPWALDSPPKQLGFGMYW